MLQSLSSEEFDAEFERWWRELQSEFFKCEVQQSYDEAGEEEFIGLFREQKIAELHALLQKDVAREESIWRDAEHRGIAFLRCHVYETPLTEYLRFELEAYKIQAEAGERIWMVPRSALAPDRPSLEDFMLFDGERALIAHYSPAGVLIGATATDEPHDLARLRAIRDGCLEVGIPLDKFLRENGGGAARG